MAVREEIRTDLTDLADAVLMMAVEDHHSDLAEIRAAAAEDRLSRVDAEPADPSRDRNLVREAAAAARPAVPSGFAAIRSRHIQGL